ncbi:FUSC family protein [Microbacterium sp. KSW4-16]|uniref:FUSC family protein n=1 Tax=Microbacterium aurugineum TaxID=2851642 RepID=UPI0020BDA5F7|nr:FUSC family protein [Microbacterium aurugineum]MCK8469055.1 FUSC family protein [Microbacterium aurugineum]
MKASSYRRNAPALSPSWLAATLRVKRAPIPVGHTVRAGIAVGVPFVIGTLTGEVLNGMWVGLAALLLAAGEREGTYRLNFLMIAVSTPIAGAGFLLGFARSTDLAMLVPCLAVVAFIAGVVAGYGPALSVASMQFLLVASIALGVNISNIWDAITLYLVGGVWYALLLAVQMAIDPWRPQRTALSGLLAALSRLAATRTESPSDRDERAVAQTTVTSALNIARTRVAEFGAGHPNSAKAWVLDSRVTDAAERVQAALMIDSDVATLDTAGRRLTELADDVRRPSANRELSNGDQTDRAYLLSTVDSLERAMRGNDTSLPPRMGPVLTPLSRETLLAATRLAICFGIAIAAKAYFPFGHWFWVPLTVCLVMKPDFGDVFTRALARIMGTLLGIGIGTLVLLVVPKGIALAIIIGVLAASVPWLMMLSYALQAAVITPIVLLLIDLIQPGDATSNTGLLRLGATVVGGAIVVVFGYLIWPRSRHRWIDRTFQQATVAISQHLRTAGTARPISLSASTERHERLVTARRDAYRALFDLRTRMDRQLSEPPPAGTVAAFWVSVCSATERLADSVTTYSTTRRANAVEIEDLDAAAVADRIEALSSADDLLLATSADPVLQAVDPVLQAVIEDRHHARTLLGWHRHSPS